MNDDLEVYGDPEVSYEPFRVGADRSRRQPGELFWRCSEDPGEVTPATVDDVIDYCRFVDNA